MAGFLTMTGRRSALNALVATTNPLVLRLFVTPAALGPNTQTPELQEAQFDGYAPVLLNGKWDITNTVPMVATHQPVRFQLGQDRPSGILIYGYMLMLSGALVAVERIGPFTLQRAGDTIVVTPTLVQA
jgi:hypothetical protein